MVSRQVIGQADGLAPGHERPRERFENRGVVHDQRFCCCAIVKW